MSDEIDELLSEVISDAYRLVECYEWGSETRGAEKDLQKSEAALTKYVNAQSARLASLESENATLKNGVEQLSNYTDEMHADVLKFEAENAALRERARWIPVSERLPEELEIVLIKSPYQTILSRLYLIDGNWIFEDPFGLQIPLEMVECWFPIPEPPSAPEVE